MEVIIWKNEILLSSEQLYAVFTARNLLFRPPHRVRPESGPASGSEGGADGGLSYFYISTYRFHNSCKTSAALAVRIAPRISLPVIGITNKSSLDPRIISFVTVSANPFHEIRSPKGEAGRPNQTKSNQIKPDSMKFLLLEVRNNPQYPLTRCPKRSLDHLPEAANSE